VQPADLPVGAEAGVLVKPGNDGSGFNILMSSIARKRAAANLYHKPVRDMKVETRKTRRRAAQSERTVRRTTAAALQQVIDPEAPRTLPLIIVLSALICVDRRPIGIACRFKKKDVGLDVGRPPSETSWPDQLSVKSMER